MKWPVTFVQTTCAGHAAWNKRARVIITAPPPFQYRYLAAIRRRKHVALLCAIDPWTERHVLSQGYGVVPLVRRCWFAGTLAPMDVGTKEGTQKCAWRRVDCVCVFRNMSSSPKDVGPHEEARSIPARCVITTQINGITMTKLSRILFRTLGIKAKSVVRFVMRPVLNVTSHVKIRASTLGARKNVMSHVTGHLVKNNATTFTCAASAFVCYLMCTQIQWSTLFIVVRDASVYVGNPVRLVQIAIQASLVQLLFKPCKKWRKAMNEPMFYPNVAASFPSRHWMTIFQRWMRKVHIVYTKLKICFLNLYNT